MSSEIVVKIPEFFSIEEAAKFREDAYKLIESGQKDFVLDFSRCQFVDSTGLGVMVAVYKKCVEKSGSFKLKNVGDTVLKVLKLTRLDHVFDIK